MKTRYKQRLQHDTGSSYSGYYNKLLTCKTRVRVPTVPLI